MAKMLIAGEPADSESEQTTEVRNPATGEVVDNVPKGTITDIRRAIDAATGRAQEMVRHGAVQTRRGSARGGPHDSSTRKRTCHPADQGTGQADARIDFGNSPLRAHPRSLRRHGEDHAHFRGDARHRPARYRPAQASGSLRLYCAVEFSRFADGQQARSGAARWQHRRCQTGRHDAAHRTCAPARSSTKRSRTPAVPKAF